MQRSVSYDKVTMYIQTPCGKGIARPFGSPSKGELSPQATEGSDPIRRRHNSVSSMIEPDPPGRSAPPKAPWSNAVFTRGLRAGISVEIPQADPLIHTDICSRQAPAKPVLDDCGPKWRQKKVSEVTVLPEKIYPNSFRRDAM